jgi:RNA polymerase sigma-70 factor (ECF subfamily)
MLDARTEKLTIDRARRGDRDAIAELIEAYQRPLEAFLFRLCGKHELAEDIAQEAFVRVIKSLHRFDDQYRFSTWLFTIGKRLLVNAQQKMKPVAEIVLLFHQQGWSVQRISEELGMPEGTIKSHLFRARRRMLFAIEQSGVSNPNEVFQ